MYAPEMGDSKQMPHNADGSLAVAVTGGAVGVGVGRGRVHGSRFPASSSPDSTHASSL